MKHYTGTFLLVTGLIYGPHTIYDLATFAATSPVRYPIRLYPDITHSITTQYVHATLQGNTHSW